MNDEFWFFQVWLWSTSKIPFAGLYILGRLSGINWLKLQSRNSTSPMSASTSSWAASSPPTAWLSSANTSATVCTGKCRNFQFEYQRKSETVNAIIAIAIHCVPDEQFESKCAGLSRAPSPRARRRYPSHCWSTTSRRDTRRNRHS